MKSLLEIACFNQESALLAAKAGANRIELCENYCVGGLTPSHQIIQNTRKEISIPLHVIIRPKEGGFVYTNAELEQMKADILFCARQGINGVVFGILTPEGKVDEEACKQLLEVTGNMSTTFHRAIDACEDYEAAIQTIIQLGFKKVLTSGGASRVVEGLDKIKDIQKQYGSKITIIPGGGIRANNLQEILSQTNCTEFHSAGIKTGFTSPSENEIHKMLEVLNKA